MLLLPQDPSFRGLVPLGIGAVGGASVAAFGEQDAALFSAGLNSVSMPVVSSSSVSLLCLLFRSFGLQLSFRRMSLQLEPRHMPVRASEPIRAQYVIPSFLPAIVVEAHLCSPRLPPVLPLAPPAAGAGTAAGGAPLPGPPSLSAMPAPVRPYAPRPAHGSDGGYGGASADGGPPPAFAEWAAAPGAQAPEGIVDWSAVSVDQRGSPSPAEGASGASMPLSPATRPSLPTATAHRCACMCRGVSAFRRAGGALWHAGAWSMRCAVSAAGNEGRCAVAAPCGRYTRGWGRTVGAARQRQTPACGRRQQEIGHWPTPYIQNNMISRRPKSGVQSRGSFRLVHAARAPPRTSIKRAMSQKFRWHLHVSNIISYPLAGRAPPRTSSKQPRLSARPPLSHCSESEFLDDVCAYLSERKVRSVLRSVLCVADT